MCPRFQGCVRRRCHPGRGTRATRRVASALQQNNNHCYTGRPTFLHFRFRMHTRELHDAIVRARLVTFSRPPAQAPGGFYHRPARYRCACTRGIPFTGPRRPISISIKGGAHVPLLENAARHKRSGRRAGPTNIPSLALGYSAGVAVVIITEPRTWEKRARIHARANCRAGPCEEYATMGPWSSLFVHQPNCSVSASRIRHDHRGSPKPRTNVNERWHAVELDRARNATEAPTRLTSIPVAPF